MAKKAKAPTDDLSAVEGLMQDIEARLRRLNSKADSDVSGGADDIADFVSQTLHRIAGQLRDTTDAATDKLADESTAASTDIIKRIWEEMQRHPLTTLALSAAAGYLLGLISRQRDSE